MRDPVYKQFKAVIKDLLLNQSRWPVGTQIATERVLAEEFKLSRVTIAKALSELEAEGLIEKRPPGGTFVTEKVRSRGLVQFLFYLSEPLSSFPGYALVLSTLEAKLSAQGIGLIFTSVISEDPGQARARVIVGPVNSDVVKLSAARTPVVTVDFGAFVENMDGVEFDNAAGAERAVEFLHMKGHRRIAYLGCYRDSDTSEWPNSARRRQGYIAGLRKAGLEVNPAFQRQSWAAARASSDVTRELLKLPKAPTALVCFNEAQAVGALETARASGARTARAFETICFSDRPNEVPLPGMAGYCVPPWTAIAEAAADLVLQRMDNAGRKASHLMLRPAWIESSALF